MAWTPIDNGAAPPIVGNRKTVKEYMDRTGITNPVEIAKATKIDVGQVAQIKQEIRQSERLKIQSIINQTENRRKR